MLFAPKPVLWPKGTPKAGQVYDPLDDPGIQYPELMKQDLCERQKRHHGVVGRFFIEVLPVDWQVEQVGFVVEVGKPHATREKI